jgi:hypothetical protein
MLLKQNGISCNRQRPAGASVARTARDWQTEHVMRWPKAVLYGIAAAVALAPPVAAAAESITAGTYVGHWEGVSGASGDFHLALASGTAGDWKADISFGMGGQEVKCKVTALTIDGAKIHAVYTFDLQGVTLESTIDGQRSGNKLSGKYRTRVVADNSAVDEGDWDASVT